jgi:DNA recombination protein RmuC
MGNEFLLGLCIVVCICIYAISYFVFKRKMKQLYLENQNSKAQYETFWSQEKRSLEHRISSLNETLLHLQNDKESLLIQLTKAETDILHLKDKQKTDGETYENMHKKFQEAFENLAQKILEEKTSKFTTVNLENMKSVLLPLQDKIMLFEKKVDATHKESIDYHAALREQILGLKSASELMSQETLNLTKALKGDSKVQGNWGELILETVLEKSGLIKDREYFVQPVHKNEQGQKQQPDVVIHLPDGKRMVIDAKVSLTAYEKFVNEADLNNQNSIAKEHLISFKKHIDGLSEKSYWDLYQIESPNFVLMFVPIESAFALALQQDLTLYNRAFEKNIVIVTPTTLLATLKTIDSMWSHQKQQENAMEIARQAGALYDKFEGFVTDLQKIGKKVEETQIVYDAAMNKLVEGKGNLVRSAQKLQKMGALTKKELPSDLVQKSIQINEND